MNPMVTTKLTRRDHLYLWNLASRTPLDRDLDAAAVLEACKRCRYPVESALALMEGHPEAWARMVQKRTAKVTGVPYPGYNRRAVAGARLANLKVMHPRKAAKMKRKGIPL